MSIMIQARTLAERTPESRNRYVDALRALSILVVVFGHWLMAGPEMVDGRLRVGHLIAEARWAQWATWIFQVMPVFFFVGGFANAGGWRSAHRAGTPYARWLRDRLRRLILPVLPVLAAWTAIATVALRAGIDPDLLMVGSQAALVPVWFLATYVLIVALTPVTLALWDRYGWRAFGATATAAALVDIANLGLGVSWMRWVNYVFVWNAVHMLGYAWSDGRIGRTRQRAAMAAGGLASLSVLVALFPYPLAMVGIDQAAVTNSNPPKVTLIALAVLQFGVAMSLEPMARRALSRIRLWTAVVAVSGSIMTLYLWHLTAMVAVLGAAMASGGAGLGLTVDTPAWWATRPIWLLLMVMATAPFLAVFGRFERPRNDTRPAPAAWKPVFAVVATGIGLALLARNGVADADGLNGLAVSLPFVGVIAGGLIMTSSGPPDTPPRGAR